MKESDGVGQGDFVGQAKLKAKTPFLSEKRGFRTIFLLHSAIRNPQSHQPLVRVISTISGLQKSLTGAIIVPMPLLTYMRTSGSLSDS